MIKFGIKCRKPKFDSLFLDATKNRRKEGGDKSNSKDCNKVFRHKIRNFEGGRLALDEQEQMTRGSLVDTNAFITPRSSPRDSIDSFLNASPFPRISSQSFSLERLSFTGRRELNRIRTFDSKIWRVRSEKGGSKEWINDWESGVWRREVEYLCWLDAE